MRVSFKNNHLHAGLCTLRCQTLLLAEIPLSNSLQYDRNIFHILPITLFMSLVPCRSFCMKIELFHWIELCFAFLRQMQPDPRVQPCYWYVNQLLLVLFLSRFDCEWDITQKWGYILSYNPIRVSYACINIWIRQCNYWLYVAIYYYRILVHYATEFI